MTRFPGLREAVHGRRLAKRGIRFSDVAASERPPYPSDRLRQWRTKYETVPLELKVENRT